MKEIIESERERVFSKLSLSLIFDKNPNIYEFQTSTIQNKTTIEDALKDGKVKIKMYKIKSIYDDLKETSGVFEKTIRDITSSCRNADKIMLDNYTNTLIKEMFVCEFSADTLDSKYVYIACRLADEQKEKLIRAFVKFKKDHLQAIKDIEELFETKITYGIDAT
jgi:hypothetical protein